MGLKKYRFDEVGAPQANGAIPIYSRWMGGTPLAGVKDCPCPDGVRRTAYVQGEPDTYFSQPAAVSIKGKRINGYLSMSDTGLEFRADNAAARIAFGLPLLEGEVAP